MNTHTQPCPFCGRLVPFTKKGAARPHLTPGGVKCVGVGIQMEPSNWQCDKPTKGITNKRPGKSRKGGAAKR